MSEAPSTSHTEVPFAVAGIGASAGGIAAIRALLDALPRDLPIAVVVIEHLDATQQSHLASIFAASSKLPVSTATDGLAVRPGHAYVIPPDADLRIEGGLLRLVPRPGPGVLHLPIDAFFESLARECGPRAIGVVLSGAGQDGANGIRAIKTAGGTTFAQDASAEHAHMPAAAEATGCVDLVLPPDRIAAELTRFAREVASLDGAVSTDDAAALAPVFKLLQRTTGIDFAAYKPATLRRRALRRALMKHHPSLASYTQSLTDDRPELALLAEDMLIRVTSFFRDPAVFDALETTVIPQLLAQRRDDTELRVWVPGCATGEEAYSIAMLLLEKIAASGAGTSLKVFGTDLSASAIDQARIARYPEAIATQISPERLARFFVRAEPGYQVRKDLRDLCIFARHDVTRDPPFSNIDLLSCRNVLIYLSAPTQQRVIQLFHYALRPNGFLVLGTSESAGAAAGFETVDAPHRILRRVEAPPRAMPHFGEPRWPTSPTSRGIVSLPVGPQFDVQREADRLVLAEYAPPGVVVDDALSILQFRGQTGLYLEPTPGAASLELLRLAREDLRSELHAAIESVRTTGASCRRPPVRYRADGVERSVAIEVLPIHPPMVPTLHFVVLFHEQPRTADAASTAGEGEPLTPARSAEEALRDELRSTRAYLESVIQQLAAGNEELRASNEEVVSSNEELQSTNEELQTAKEELQATNEELSTINDEMSERNIEGRRLADDLSNVLASVGIGIVLLGRDRRIRRFTQAAARLLNLIGTDVGRPLSDIQPKVRAPELPEMIGDVLEHLTAREARVQDDAGRWYQLTVRPYTTTDMRIDGVVLTFVDIDALQRSSERIAEAAAYAECIVDTVREPLLVLDGSLVVRSANRAFYAMFGRSRADTEGRKVTELGLPAVAAVASGALESPALEETRVEEQVSGSRRRLTVTGRRMDREGGALLLLAIDDITDTVLNAELATKRERALRDMLTTASAAIVIVDRHGAIRFANDLARATFGYDAGTLEGMPLATLIPEDRRAVHAGYHAAFVQSPKARAMGVGRELVARRRDGTTFPVEVSLSTMYDGDDGLQIVALIFDISARRAAELTVAESKRRLREMAFDAAVATEDERRRIAADLHDRIGQALALAQLKLAAERDAARDRPHASLDEAIALIERSIVDARTLIFDLSPPVLYDLGLAAAVSWLADDVEKRHGLRVEVTAPSEVPKLDDHVAALAFRGVQELLTNVVKHARTRAARVTLRVERAELVIVVEDRGVGFDPAATNGSRDPLRGFGLLSVRERMTRLGGSFHLESSVGGGTIATLRIPLERGLP